MCGEKERGAVAVVPVLGSPPRVRGEADGAAHPLTVTGITPACAGRRPAACRKSGCGRDHPRVCGEKAHVVVALDHDIGSPPRVRGEARCLGNAVVPQQITPACAGRSLQEKPTTATNGDHPRVCGEKFERQLLPLPLRGSPPRVRGEVDALVNRIALMRITPACAGRSRW